MNEYSSDTTEKIEDDINTFINANNRKYDLFIYIIIA